MTFLSRIQALLSPDSKKNLSYAIYGGLGGIPSALLHGIFYKEDQTIKENFVFSIVRSFTIQTSFMNTTEGKPRHDWIRTFPSQPRFCRYCGSYKLVEPEREYHWWYDKEKEREFSRTEYFLYRDMDGVLHKKSPPCIPRQPRSLKVADPDSRYALQKHGENLRKRRSERVSFYIDRNGTYTLGEETVRILEKSKRKP